ncbi:hypothetical protein EOD39_11332 [Acipenser ruthenus]|uniref:Uncharacterized protein n=1 Tax=Acipenser ruthenus TaxID=7906 RepID=A0A444UP82_ACIRT|nr:hypothetical protein EOD39_11332 [Acipenser ruthenus]
MDIKMRVFILAFPIFERSKLLILLILEIDRSAAAFVTGKVRISNSNNPKGSPVLQNALKNHAVDYHGRVGPYLCLSRPGSKRVDPHPEVGRCDPGQPEYDPGQPEYDPGFVQFYDLEAELVNINSTSMGMNSFYL